MMAGPIGSDSGSSTAGVRSMCHAPRRPSRLSVRHNAALEGAGSVPPRTGEQEEVPDVKSGSKRGNSNEVAVGDRSAAMAVTDRQVADDPCEGAVTPSQPCRGQIPSRGGASQEALR